MLHLWLFAFLDIFPTDRITSFSAATCLASKKQHRYGSSGSSGGVLGRVCGGGLQRTVHQPHPSWSYCSRF